MRGKQIIFADKYYRQLSEGGKIKRLVEYPFIGSPVPEESDGNTIVPLYCGGQRGSHSQGDGAADDSSASCCLLHA